MIDFRLYRLCFVPALVAVIVVMFSLEGAPEPLEPVAPPSTFDGARAAGVARQIATTAPERAAGSAGDAAIADLVHNRFEEIPAGAVSEQPFTAADDNGDASLRNVILTLPGDSDETIVIVAGRDAPQAPGAASSAAATGILIELANAFRISHQKTFVLASISGSSGAAGIRALVDNLPERDSIEAVIVISQPGALDRRPPFVVSSSTGTRSASVQLERTAERAVEVQAGESSAGEGAFTQLARLAIPSGLGDQAPLIAAGEEAIAISSAGEPPLSAADDQLDDLAAKSVDAFGRAVQSTVTALDVAVATPIHGPASHLELGDNLMPGWALAALALGLILPAAVASIDACARAARRQLAIGAAVAWAAARSLPFVGALAVLYLLAIFGLVPRPSFPFDPALYGLGARAAIAFVLIAVAAGATAWLLRSRGISARRAPAAAVAGLGALGSLACLALWLANPYLALLTVGVPHLWLAMAGEAGAARRTLTVAACLLSCLPLLAALVAVAGALDLGLEAPWTYTLMVADGQIGLVVMLCLSFLAGTVAGVASLALTRGAQSQAVPGGEP